MGHIRATSQVRTMGMRNDVRDLAGLHLVEDVVDRYAAEAEGGASAPFRRRADPQRPAPEARRADAA